MMGAIESRRPEPAVSAESDLDRDGFVVLPGLLDAAALQTARRAFCEGNAAGERAEFQALIAHAEIDRRVRAVLGRPYRLLLASGRAPSVGEGRQGLHQDWIRRGPEDPFVAVTVLWMLDDFRADNGATRVVPGSHLIPRELPKSMQDPAAHHSRERLVTGAAGAALVLNGHLWHSGTMNPSGMPRSSLPCQYVAADSSLTPACSA